ncbi:MAG: type VI secretion system lipoprotein TssJ [Zoogloea sp.]|uniref:type VI secretion system lipoprotein TssJ n=1 Tax=Zoogloea sp. TaxID=49181 RepID=UPI002617B9D4|nr:type VI secretion system lipoprotein TssJ [Zoogloea sp.]MDD3327009.1 type VI secretion system lipoprotein TssJ [Zoogloea sp.]
MSPRRRLAATLATLATLALAGCAAKPIALPPIFKPDPTVVRLQLAADAQVNADSRGRATPVVVRYYVLTNTAAFDSADFFSLFERDEALLGTAVLAREETTLKPGQVLKVELSPQGEARHLAVLAAYRDVNKIRWRATAPIPQNKTTAYIVRIGAQGITISPPPP